MLNARPHPYPHETAHGYFLRLANCNGFVSNPEMFAARGFKTYESLTMLERARVIQLC